MPLSLWWLTHTNIKCPCESMLTRYRSKATKTDEKSEQTNNQAESESEQQKETKIQNEILDQANFANVLKEKLQLRSRFVINWWPHPDANTVGFEEVYRWIYLIYNYIYNFGVFHLKMTSSNKKHNLKFSMGGWDEGSTTPKSSSSGQCNGKHSKKAEIYLFHCRTWQAFLIFQSTLLLGYERVCFRGAYNVKWKVKELLSLPKLLSIRAGWIFILRLCVYLAELYPLKFMHYILIPYLNRKEEQ